MRDEQRGSVEREQKTGKGGRSELKCSSVFHTNNQPSFSFVCFAFYSFTPCTSRCPWRCDDDQRVAGGTQVSRRVEVCRVERKKKLMMR